LFIPTSFSAIWRIPYAELEDICPYRELGALHNRIAGNGRGAVQGLESCLELEEPSSNGIANTRIVLSIAKEPSRVGMAVLEWGAQRPSAAFIK
jgi:hypothetical protein